MFLQVPGYERLSMAWRAWLVVPLIFLMMETAFCCVKHQSDLRVIQLFSRLEYYLPMCAPTVLVYKSVKVCISANMLGLASGSYTSTVSAGRQT